MAAKTANHARMQPPIPMSTTSQSDVVAQIAVRLRNSQLSALGARLLDKRLAACTYLSVHALPQSFLQAAYEHTYLQLWIYGLDDLLDTCPSVYEVLDVEQVINRILNLSSEPKLVLTNLNDLELTNDLLADLPRLGFSIFSLATTLQQLRRRIRSYQAAPEGRLIFDACLGIGVLPAMKTEALWRLGQLPPPDYETYMATAHISICAAQCLSLVNSLLNNPRQNWQIVSNTVKSLGYALRLINDLSTRKRDTKEGKPNAVNLLSQELGNAAAVRQVREYINTYSQKVNKDCSIYLDKGDKDNPLYVLSYYMQSCLAAARRMYEKGDFVIPAGRPRIRE